MRLPNEFDGAAILGLRCEHDEAFVAERERWIRNICAGNKVLTERQISHLEAQNKRLNLAIRLVEPFQKNSAFWSLPSEQQAGEMVRAVQRMKPLLDFFVR